MTNEATTKEIQGWIGATQDGVWGPKSQKALIAANDVTKREIQALLRVKADGVWGPKSQAALDAITKRTEVFDQYASSFADPADLVAFTKCKLKGNTDLFCFRVGDNGIGQFGKITAQEHTPMVAVHGDAMKAKWGSIPAAAHRMVRVKANGKSVDAAVEDRISAPGRIDLNPAAAKALGLKPPFVVPAEWEWL